MERCVQFSCGRSYPSRTELTDVSLKCEPSISNRSVRSVNGVKTFREFPVTEFCGRFVFFHRPVIFAADPLYTIAIPIFRGDVRETCFYPPHRSVFFRPARARVPHPGCHSPTKEGRWQRSNY